MNVPNDVLYSFAAGICAMLGSFLSLIVHLQIRTFTTVNKMDAQMQVNEERYISLKRHDERNASEIEYLKLHLNKGD